MSIVILPYPVLSFNPISGSLSAMREGLERILEELMLWVNPGTSQSSDRDEETEETDPTDPPKVVKGYVGISVGISLRMHLPREVDSENLLVIAEVQSTDELRSVLDRLTLDEACLVEVSMPSKWVRNISPSCVNLSLKQLRQCTGWLRSMMLNDSYALDLWFCAANQNIRWTSSSTTTSPPPSTTLHRFSGCQKLQAQNKPCVVKGTLPKHLAMRCQFFLSFAFLCYFLLRKPWLCCRWRLKFWMAIKSVFGDFKKQPTIQLPGSKNGFYTSRAKRAKIGKGLRFLWFCCGAWWCPWHTVSDSALFWT